MRQLLIPIGDGGDVVLQRQVAAAGLPAQALDGHFEVVVEADRIGNVPAIEAEALLRIVHAVRADDLRHAGVGRGEFRVGDPLPSAVVCSKL